MNVVRKLRHNDYDNIDRLTNVCFDAEVDNKGNGMNFGVFDLVSYIHIFPFDINIDDENYKVWGISALCTASDFRGNGYASQLIDIALYKASQKFDQSSNEGVDFVILYGESEFYSKFGFVEVPFLYEDRNMMVYLINDSLHIECMIEENNIEDWKAIPVF